MPDTRTNLKPAHRFNRKSRLARHWINRDVVPAEVLCGLEMTEDEMGARIVADEARVSCATCLRRLEARARRRDQEVTS